MTFFIDVITRLLLVECDEKKHIPYDNFLCSSSYLNAFPVRLILVNMISQEQFEVKKSQTKNCLIGLGNKLIGPWMEKAGFSLKIIQAVVHRFWIYL